MPIATIILERGRIEGGALLMLLCRDAVPQSWAVAIERPVKGNAVVLAGLGPGGEEVACGDPFCAGDERAVTSVVAIPERIAALEGLFAKERLLCASFAEAKRRFDQIWRHSLDAALGECMAWVPAKARLPADEKAAPRKGGRPRKHSDDRARKRAAEERMRDAGFIRVTVKVRADRADQLRAFAKKLT